MLDKAVRDHLGRQLRSLYTGGKERDRHLLGSASAPARPEPALKAKADNAG